MLTRFARRRRSVTQLRDNYKISQILSALKNRVMENNSDETLRLGLAESVLSSFDSMSDILNVDYMASAPLDSVLLDLLMYESDDLFENSLLTLNKKYMEVEEMVSVLPRMTLLIDSRIPIFEDVSCLTESLSQLSFYTRSYEVWAVHSCSKRDVRSYNHICYLLNKLLVFIYSPSYDSTSFEDFSVETKADKARRIERYVLAERKAMDKEESNSMNGHKGDGGGGQKRRVQKRSDSVSDFSIFGYNSPPSILLLKANKKPNRLHQDLLRSMGIVNRIIAFALRIEGERVRGANDAANSTAVSNASNATSDATRFGCRSLALRED